MKKIIQASFATQVKSKTKHIRAQTVLMITDPTLMLFLLV